jgi:hypothetical protein
MMQGLVEFNYPNYVPHRYQGTLIMWGFVLLPVAFNVGVEPVLALA